MSNFMGKHCYNLLGRHLLDKRIVQHYLLLRPKPAKKCVRFPTSFGAIHDKQIGQLKAHLIAIDLDGSA